LLSTIAIRAARYQGLSSNVGLVRISTPLHLSESTLTSKTSVCPQAWIQFSLLPHDPQHPASGVLEIETKEKIEPPTLEVLIPSKILQEKTYLKYFSSSEGVHRTFCGRCATHFTFHWTTTDDDDEDNETQKIWGPYFDMAMGTFDRESLDMEGMRPARQSWWDDGIKWVQEMVGE
jgi:hypothetical protein